MARTSISALRAIGAAALAAIATLFTVAPAQAFCPNEQLIVGPTVIVAPVDCARVSGQFVVGDILNNTDIGGPLIDDNAFVIESSTITGQFVNNGTLTQSGNFGSSAALATWGSDVEGGIVNNGSIVSPLGIAFSIGAVVDSVPVASIQTGAIDNFGTIQGTIGFEGIAGKFLNTLWNHQGALITGDFAILTEGTFDEWSGGIVNDGQISGVSSAIGLGTFNTTPLTFSGGIQNSATGTITASNGSAIGIFAVFNGGIENAGVISGSTGILNGGIFSGGISNTGQISGAANGITSQFSFSGGIANDGQIDGGTTGVLAQGNFSGGIQNTGTISGSGDAGVRVDAGAVFADGITNSGSITGGVGAILSIGNFSGGILNTDTGSIAGGFWGVVLGGAFAGGIDNAGTISGSNAGIFSFGGFSGGINNSGDVTGTAFGIRMSNAVTFTGGITNTSTGTISGALNSAISLEGTSSGGLNNAGVISSNNTAISITGTHNGGIVNSGQIVGTTGYGISMGGAATVTNGLQNSGSITGGFTAVILDGDFSGGVTNSGTIVGNQGFGLLSLGLFEGGIDNAGSIVGHGILAEPQGSDPFNSVDGGIGVLITGPTFNSGVFEGTFLNRAAGVIEGTYLGVKMLGASFTGEFRNAGQIVGGDPLDLTGFGYSFGASLSYAAWEGDIINEATGSIVASSPNAGVPGYNFPNAGLEIGLFDPIDSLIKVSTFQGNVINDGLIGGPTGIAMFLNVFEGSVLNGAGALIDGVNGHGMLLDVTDWTGNLENAGQIRSATAAGVRFIGNANGVDIVNSALGRIEGLTTGIHATGANFVGSIDNAGWIAATDTSPDLFLPSCDACGISIAAATVDVDIVNRSTGAIFGAQYGLRIEADSTTGSILNQGSIQSTERTGLSLYGGFAGEVDVDVVNNGTITGGTQGFLAISLLGGWTGSLTNTGTITATSDAEQNATGVGVSTSYWTGQIVNSGTIVSTVLDSGAGLMIEPSMGGPHTVLADIINSGSISGFDGVALFMNGTWDGTLTNSGSIAGTRYAILLEGAGGDGIFNSGAVQGSVNLSFVDTGLTYRQTGDDAFTGTTTSIFSLSNSAVTTLDFRAGYLYGDVLGGADLNDLFQVNAGANGRFEYVTGTASNLASFAVNSGTAVIGDAEITTNALSVATNATLHMSNSAVINAQNVTFAPNSTFAAELTTNTAAHPTINVSGTATLGGAFVAHIDPMAFAGSGENQWVYDGIISGPVTGTFSSVTIFGAPNLFTITPAYNSLDITITLNAFDDLIEPTNPNQVSVGEAIQEIYEDGTTDPDLINLIDTLANATDDEIADIFDAIAGSTQAETGMTAMRSDDPWKQSVGQRVNAARSTGCTVAGDTWCLRRYAQAPSPVSTDAAEDPHAFDWLETGLRDSGTTSMWGRLVGIWGESDGGASSPGSRQRTRGLVGGADHVVSGTFLVGIAGQYVNTTSDFDGSANRSLVEAVQVGPYFSYGGAEMYVNGNASVIGTRSQTDRFFSIGGIDYAAAVRFPSTTYTASLEAGSIYEVDGYRLEPNIGINYAIQLTDEYAEGGAGGLGLIIDPQDLNSLRTLVGGRISRVYDIGDRKIVPEFRVEWRHEYLDRAHTFEAAFAGAPDVAFLVSCSPTARDVLAIGGSMTVPVSGRVTGYLDAEGAFSDDTRSGTLSLGVRATW